MGSKCCSRPKPDAPVVGSLAEVYFSPRASLGFSSEAPAGLEQESFEDAFLIVPSASRPTGPAVVGHPPGCACKDCRDSEGDALIVVNDGPEELGPLVVGHPPGCACKNCRSDDGATAAAGTPKSGSDTVDFESAFESLPELKPATDTGATVIGHPPGCDCKSCTGDSVTATINTVDSAAQLARPENQEQSNLDRVVPAEINSDVQIQDRERIEQDAPRDNYTGEKHTVREQPVDQVVDSSKETSAGLTRGTELPVEKAFPEETLLRETILRETLPKETLSRETLTGDVVASKRDFASTTEARQVDAALTQSFEPRRVEVHEIRSPEAQLTPSLQTSGQVQDGALRPERGPERVGLQEPGDRSTLAAREAALNRTVGIETVETFAARTESVPAYIGRADRTRVDPAPTDAPRRTSVRIDAAALGSDTPNGTTPQGVRNAHSQARDIAQRLPDKGRAPRDPSRPQPAESARLTWQEGSARALLARRVASPVALPGAAVAERRGAGEESVRRGDTSRNGSARNRAERISVERSGIEKNTAGGNRAERVASGRRITRNGLSETVGAAAERNTLPRRQGGVSPRILKALARDGRAELRKIDKAESEMRPPQIRSAISERGKLLAVLRAKLNPRHAPQSKELAEKRVQPADRSLRAGRSALRETPAAEVSSRRAMRLERRREKNKTASPARLKEARQLRKSPEDLLRMLKASRGVLNIDRQSLRRMRRELMQWQEEVATLLTSLELAERLALMEERLGYSVGRYRVLNRLRRIRPRNSIQQDGLQIATEDLGTRAVSLSPNRGAKKTRRMIRQSERKKPAKPVQLNTKGPSDSLELDEVQLADDETSVPSVDEGAFDSQRPTAAHR